jgi:hypothetical protein
MTNDIITIENYVDEQCMRHVHLMSNLRQSLLSAQREGGGEIKQGTGIHYYRAEYPYRGILDIHCEGWLKFRRLVVWHLDGCGSVREAIQQAFIYFWVTFKFQPGYAFMKKLPKSIEHAAPIALWALPPNGKNTNLGEEGELILLEVDWMLERCVAVGGRG